MHHQRHISIRLSRLTRQILEFRRLTWQHLLQKEKNRWKHVKRKYSLTLRTIRGTSYRTLPQEEILQAQDEYLLVKRMQMDRLFNTKQDWLLKDTVKDQDSIMILTYSPAVQCRAFFAVSSANNRYLSYQPVTILFQNFFVLSI